MNPPSRPFLFRNLHLPKRVWALALLVCVASFLQFAHHAEFLATYPGTPEDATRESVYVAWLELSAVGLAACVCAMFRLGVLAGSVLTLYGVLALMAALNHYALGYWDEYTLLANLTICFEALCSSALAVWALRATGLARDGAQGVQSGLPPHGGEHSSY